MQWVDSVSMRVDYRCNGQRYHALDHWVERQISEIYRRESPHGPLSSIEVIVGPDVNGLRYTLEFALPVDRALFFWRVIVDNLGSDPVYVDRISLLDLVLPEGELKDPAFFSNGWGSWNFSAVYGLDDRYRRTRLGPITSPTRVNSGTPQPCGRGRFSSDMFGVLGDRRDRVALLAGFVSQLNHFGSLEARLGGREPGLRIWANGDGARLDPNARIETDWACLQFVDVDALDPWGPYLDAVARQNRIRPIPTESPAGWCSWYHFMQNIDAQIIKRNLSAMVSLRDELPLQVLQIDDGFETRIGDWFSFKSGFPGGVAPLATEIEGEGFIPGLWLAPYMLDRASQVVNDHPDWVLRGRFNLPVNAGYIWDRFTTALDLTHPEALAYTQDVVSAAVEEWGFPYLKLDFLYAAASARSLSRSHTHTRTGAAQGTGSAAPIRRRGHIFTGLWLPPGFGVGIGGRHAHRHGCGAMVAP